MKSLKDKKEVIEIKSNHIQRLEEVYYSKDVKEAVLADKDKFEELHRDIIQYLKHKSKCSVQHMQYISFMLSHYKENKGEIFGVFE